MANSRLRSALVALGFVCVLVVPLPVAAWFGLPSAVAKFIFFTAPTVATAVLIMPGLRQAAAFTAAMTSARAGDALWRTFVADDWRAVLVSASIAGVVSFALRRQLRGTADGTPSKPRA